MANLLPKQYLKTIKRERLYRVLVVVFIGLFVVEIIGIAFLVPSFILARSRAGDAEREVELAQEYIAQQEQTGVLEDARATRTMIERLEVELDAITLSKILAGLDASVQPGITFEAIDYTRVAKQSDKLAIKGTAATRDTLLTFARSLNSTPLFSDVSVPVSNLAQGTNIHFSLSITVLDEQQAKSESTSS